MSSTVSGSAGATGASGPVPRPAIPPATPTIAAPVKRAGPDPRLHPDHDWGTDSELGIAIAHIKAWILARAHANSEVPQPE